MFTLANTVVDGDVVVKNYVGEFDVALAGNSIWSDTSNKTVHVTGATIVAEVEDGEVLDDTQMIYVAHNSTWDIYTDTAFERAVSEALGFSVIFTEQGMQEDGNASLETA